MYCRNSVFIYILRYLRHCVGIEEDLQNIWKIMIVTDFFFKQVKKFSFQNVKRTINKIRPAASLTFKAVRLSTYLNINENFQKIYLGMKSGFLYTISMNDRAWSCDLDPNCLGLGWFFIKGINRGFNGIFKGTFPWRNLLS